MSGKSRYSLRLIRRNYTYSVYEISELFGITPDTVFRWIRNAGLKRIPGTRKYFVHGSELATFLEMLNSKNKQPCKDGEIYCCKCKKPRRPKPGSVRSKKLPNKTFRVLGRCVDCDTKMNTLVSEKKWSINHPLHPNNNAVTNPNSGEHESLRECQTRQEEQLCLSLTL